MADHYTQLLEWRRNEAAVRGLAKLPHDFYRSTTAYLAEVRTSYEGDLRENPSGRKGEIARQTYQRASQIARDIVEARAQKVIAAAFQSSIGGTPELPNALAEERAMFDSVLGALALHRRDAAPYLDPIAATPSLPVPVSRPAPALSPAADAPTPRPSRSPLGLTYVRILKNSRPIEVGPDTIDLRADDVVSLPPEAAKILIDAKIAEPISTGPTRTVT